MYNKRKYFGKNRAANIKRTKGRVLIGKPNQSNTNIALQLKEAAEYLSANGFPSTAQFIDVTKPEPVRMDFDISMISPTTVAAPQLVDANPHQTRGRARAPAQEADPVPDPAQVPITPERQAQINAFYSTKVKRDADYLQEIHNLKVKLVSKDCMTTEFMNLFKEKEPGYIQLPPRSLANQIVKVYDNLVSQDVWKVRQDADKEYQALAQSEQESIDQYFQRFTNTYWNRNSKYTAAQEISERDACRKLVEGLNTKFNSMKSRLAQGQEHSNEFLLSNPSFDYPHTISDAKIRIENEESRIDSEKPKQFKPGKSYVGLDKTPPRNKPKYGDRLIPQSKLPFNIDKNQKFRRKLNGHVVTGANLKPEDKPSEFGYMYCPICYKRNFRNDHFKYFHQQFMDKVVSKRKEPENPTANVLTKDDLQQFGKELAASIAEAIK